MERLKASHSAISMALLSAFLFGASTPAAKALLGEMAPLLLAGLLYLGSGIGLGIFITAANLLRGSKRTAQEARLKRDDLPWLSGAVIFGGVLGPLLLLIGLQAVTASTASLLLNLEAVFTALIAWFVFHENVDRRVALGMFVIVIGGTILCLGSSWSFNFHFSTSSIYIAGACLCWAIDNNLTRKIANANPLHIAAIKGIVAGISNCSLALTAGNALPPLPAIFSASAVGLLGYGLSLSLFIRAMRDLGTARTSAYFSVAPFIGAALSIFFLHDSFTIQILLSGVLMALGVWLHLTERHEHAHRHEAMEHEHKHVHDQHHQHEHDPSVDLKEPHSHIHKHEDIVHNHPHFPDMHHKHHR
jgi:drug/metabolite transporter (DMT)-like permease